MDEISELTFHIIHGSFIRLTWVWPTNCQKTYVVWEEGDPFSADTLKKKVHQEIVTLATYNAAGNYFDIPAGERPEDFCIMISAVYQRPSKQQGLGIRRCVWQKSLITITYEFERSPHGGSQIRFTDYLSNHFKCWHPHLRVGYKEHRPPIDENDCGRSEIILQPCDPTDPTLETKWHETVQLNGNQLIPPYTYGRIVTVDPVYAHCVTFHHPIGRSARVS